MDDTYRGDETLDRLLRRAGSPLGAARVRRLVRGVVAAPEPFEPDAWMVLVAARPGAELAGQLAALRARLAAAADDGLDGPGNQAPARLEAL
ncbi:MAG: aminopeptidase P family protein, partial [Proteobacteria bacterium]|nr:aminopeptidase P family protein [Pseudomonadota bacterium]